MTLTRAQVESILIKRCGKRMAVASMNNTVVDGTNGDMNDPIGTALRQMEITLTDISNVTNADLSVLEPDQYDELLDRSELRLLENIIGNLDVFDISIGQRRESFSQLVSQTEAVINRLKATIDKKYGSASLAETGSISFGFQETYDD